MGSTAQAGMGGDISGAFLHPPIHFPPWEPVLIKDLIIHACIRACCVLFSQKQQQVLAWSLVSLALHRGVKWGGELPCVLPLWKAHQLESAWGRPGPLSLLPDSAFLMTKSQR